jgi:hypothetical protein
MQMIANAPAERKMHLSDCRYATLKLAWQMK